MSSGASECSAGSEEDGFSPSSLDLPRYCAEHEENLSLFCVDDLEPLCTQCAADRHAQHRVYLATDAASDCKEELKTAINGLNVKLHDLEKVIQTWEHASRFNQTQFLFTEERMKMGFEELHLFLRQEEAARLLSLRQAKEEKAKKIEERRNRMDELIKSLEEKIQLVEDELDAGGEGVEFLQHYQDTINSTCSTDREPLIDVAKHLGNLRYAVWEKMKHIAPCTPVTLDPRTAGESLSIAPELNSFQITPASSHVTELQLAEAPLLLNNPESVHCILGSEGFSAGVHCWDVEVGDADIWTIGIASQSGPRKTGFETCPAGGFWCICRKDGAYQALTTPSQTLSLSNPPQLSRVRVRLDFDEGRLEFLNAASDRLLFAFTHHFVETVYPYFESRSPDGLSLLEQQVDISIMSECEDNIVDLEEQKVQASSLSHASANIDEGENKIGNACSKEKSPVKKQSRKQRFNVTYHVSLNSALKDINKNLETVKR